MAWSLGTKGHLSNMEESSSALGIDIGGTRVKVARLFEGCWSLGESEQYEKPSRKQLLGAIMCALHGAGHVEGDVPRVGLCVPGIPSADGRCIEIAVNVPGLVGWAFQDMIREATGAASAKVIRAGDAEAAMLDWWRMHEKPKGRLLGVAIGTGVGMAVLDDGEVLRVTDGGSGHLGQIDVGVDSSRVGPDGGRGGLEAFVGASAVVEAGGVEAAFARGGMSLEALVRAIRICHAMYRPDSVVLLGGVGRRLRSNAALEPAIRDGLTSIARPGWSLTFGEDDHHAARGAASIAAAGLQR